MSGEGVFRLLPLDCPSCGAAVDAEGEDVVYYCVACRNGYRFGSPEAVLEPLEVAFVAVPQVTAGRYAPFWELEATVGIEDRRVSGGRPAAWLNRFFDGHTGEESRDRKGRGRFIVPAFATPLDRTLELTRRYTQAVPELGERLGEKLTGGCYGVDDARKLAHFAVIASEVDKRDTLTQLKYRIRFGPHRLLGVPLTARGEGWVDSLFGIGI